MHAQLCSGDILPRPVPRPVPGSQEFKHEQERLRRKNEAQFAHADAEMQGRNAKTVYRDKHGRRVDKDAEVAKQKAIADGLEAKQKAEEYLWNTGAVQKKKRQAEAQHLAHEAAKPLARCALPRTTLPLAAPDTPSAGHSVNCCPLHVHPHHPSAHDLVAAVQVQGRH